MIPQQSNTSNVQFPLFSPQNPNPRRISKAKINPDKHTKKRHNTQSNIQFSQSGPIDFLNKSNFPNTSRKINSNSKLINLQNNENENFNTSSWTNIEFNKLFPTSFKPNLSNLYNKNSRMKTAVKSLLLPRKDRNIISIRIETNWENSDYISMNFLSLYDKYNKHINPMNNEKIRIASIPEPSSLNKLEYLLDTSYAKEDKNIFNELFENKNFTIFISIDISIEIGSIRIFNSPIKKQSAVKDVSIYMNDKLCVKGQIPQNFGVNFYLNDYSIIHNQENQFLLPKVTFYSDKYGILSIEPITELRFEIIETYNSTIFETNDKNQINKQSLLKNSTKSYVGVNGFDFIDFFGNLISTIQDENENETEKDINYIKEVKIRGIRELINRGMLLKKNKITTQENEMLLGIADNSQLPSFHFTFNKPTYLSKVLVWNYNGFGNHLNCGIKKIKLYVDQKLLWIGKIPKGNGKFMENFHPIQLFDSINDLTKTSA